MQTRNLKSWEEFENEVQQLNLLRHERAKDDYYISDYIFRGQSDSNWKLQTTLDRNIDRPVTMLKYYDMICNIKQRVEGISSRSWPIISLTEFSEFLQTAGLLRPGVFPGYEYFAYLRHHGFPSPLLDWTQSPNVAAYFAFRDTTSTAAYVSIYAFCEYSAGLKLGSSYSPRITVQGPNIKTHTRHENQKSCYTICLVNSDKNLTYAPHEEVFTTNKEDQDELWKFNIPLSERGKVLSLLNNTITAYLLFGSEESYMETLFLQELFCKIQK